MIKRGGKGIAHWLHGLEVGVSSGKRLERILFVLVRAMGLGGRGGGVEGWYIQSYEQLKRKRIYFNGAVLGTDLVVVLLLLV